MKVLVAGCSFAQAVPGIIKDKIPGALTISVARGAAGNKYISDSVIVSCLKESFDLIYVSWSGLSRHDAVVESLDHFQDYPNKHTIHSANYVFTGGIGGWDHLDHYFVNKLFEGYHKFVDHEQLYYNSLLEIIKTQSFLTDLGTPYYFTSMINQFDADPTECVHHTCEYGVTKYPRLSYLVNAINFDKWIFDGRDGIYESCQKNDQLSVDGFHPNMEGYGRWIDLFVKRLKKDKII